MSQQAPQDGGGLSRVLVALVALAILIISALTVSAVLLGPPRV